MKVICDIEGDGLVPKNIWCIVCKDIDTGERYIFRNVTKDNVERDRFTSFASGVSYWVGHNFLGYDYPALHRLLGLTIVVMGSRCCDTLIASKMSDYSRANGHSLEVFGTEFGIEKSTVKDFSKWSIGLEERCIIDVEINHKLYLKLLKVVREQEKALDLEYNFQLLVNNLETNGFSFNRDKATKLLSKVTDELGILDKDILSSFLPKLKLIREVTPRLTKFGTISRSSIPRSLGEDLSIFVPEAPFSHCEWVAFNPASHKQIIAVLNEAGWSPIDKTQTHIDTERELNRSNYSDKGNSELTQETRHALMGKLEELRKTGWKVNENNLSTLPSTAPSPARLLAKRILLESRRRTITEWLGLVAEDDRIHGKFYGIGAWTHRMSHQKPNTANIPSEFREDGSPKLLGREMRQLWRAPRNRLLVGVDAEGIQLRVFAHYIDDLEFTKALVEGKKSDKTDPHSLNQSILGRVCKTRLASKRFIFALLLGAGMSKLAQILGCTSEEAEEALDRVLKRYTGFARLKQTQIPSDARRGFFVGLDGRKVNIPGEDVGYRKHLCMSGYLQNGEAVVMKAAAVKWHNDPEMLEIHKEYPWYFVDMVHDEWQTEVVNNMKIALRIAEIQANSLKLVGEELGLKCPLAGSFYNEDHKDYTIGTNWYQTH